MVRMVGLTLTAVLMAFQLWYTHAPDAQRAYVPSWVRGGANVAAHAILDASDAVGDAIGPQAKRGWAETKMRLGLMARPDAPRTGMMAVGADLSGQAFVAERLDEATFLRANLTGADFTKAFLVRAMLDGATAQGTVFERAVMEGASMRTAVMTGAKLAGADLTAVQAQGADLRVADLSGTKLGRAQLSAADLSGASLVGAKMTRAVLFGADLSGADLSAVTGLRQEQLSEACGDAATILPDGLTVPDCAPAAVALR